MRNATRLGPAATRAWTGVAIGVVLATLPPCAAHGGGGDTCASAQIIPWASIIAFGGYTEQGTTGTNNNVGVTCGVDGSEVFFQFTPAADAIVDITTCSGWDSDTILTLKTFADCAANVALACNDDGCACFAPFRASSLLNVPVTGGTAYVIQIDNWGSTASAPFQLHITFATSSVDPRSLYESLDRLGPGNVVASPVASPFLHSSIPQAPVIYYTVFNRFCLSPVGTLLAVRRGMDAEFTF